MARFTQLIRGELGCNSRQITFKKLHSLGLSFFFFFFLNQNVPDFLKLCVGVEKLNKDIVGRHYKIYEWKMFRN